MEQVVIDLAVELGEREACEQVGCSRASFRRHHQLASQSPGQQPRYHVRAAIEERPRDERRRGRSSLALRVAERQAVLDAVHEPRFVDRSVPHIYATLLDEGIYHCSMSTMYRVLHSVGEVGERRDQATRPAHVKPELCATAARQVFAWDSVSRREHLIMV